MKTWLSMFGIAALLSIMVSIGASGHEPVDYKKQVRQFPGNSSWQKGLSFVANEYCYDGVVYVRMTDTNSGNLSTSSAKFDRNTKQVVTCK